MTLFDLLFIVVFLWVVLALLVIVVAFALGRRGLARAIIVAFGRICRALPGRARRRLPRFSTARVESRRQPVLRRLVHRGHQCAEGTVW